MGWTSASLLVSHNRGDCCDMSPATEGGRKLSKHSDASHTLVNGSWSLIGHWLCGGFVTWSLSNVSIENTLECSIDGPRKLTYQVHVCMDRETYICLTRAFYGMWCKLG